MQTQNSFAARLRSNLSPLRRDRRGNVWVEYLILVALLGLAGIGAIKGLSGAVNGTTKDVATGVTQLSGPYKSTATAQ